MPYGLRTQIVFSDFLEYTGFCLWPSILFRLMNAPCVFNIAQIICSFGVEFYMCWNLLFLLLLCFVVKTLCIFIHFLSTWSAGKGLWNHQLQLLMYFFSLLTSVIPFNILRLNFKCLYVQTGYIFLLYYSFTSLQYLFYPLGIFALALNSFLPSIESANSDLSIFVCVPEVFCFLKFYIFNFSGFCCCYYVCSFFNGHYILDQCKNLAWKFLSLDWLIFQFSGAAVTIDHSLGGLNNRTVLPGSPGSAQSRCQWVWFPEASLRGCPLASSRGPSFVLHRWCLSVA